MPSTTPPTASAPPSRRRRCRNSRSSPRVHRRIWTGVRRRGEHHHAAPAPTTCMATVYGYLRNRNIQAVNPFTPRLIPAYTRVQAGFTFSGAIKKDRTFFFLSFETNQRNGTGFSTIGQNNWGFVPFDARSSAAGFAPLGACRSPPIRRTSSDRWELCSQIRSSRAVKQQLGTLARQLHGARRRRLQASP